MKVKVLSNINSGQYVAGDIVVMDGLEAKQLIEAGAVETTEEEVNHGQENTEVPAEAQEATAPQAPLAPAQPPVDSVSEQLEAPATPSPTAEQIAQDVAATESKSEV